MTAGQTWLLPAPILHVRGFFLWSGVVQAASTPCDSGIKVGWCPQTSGSITGCDRGWGYHHLPCQGSHPLVDTQHPQPSPHPCDGCQRWIAFLKKSLASLPDWVIIHFGGISRDYSGFAPACWAGEISPWEAKHRNRYEDQPTHTAAPRNLATGSSWMWLVLDLRPQGAGGQDDHHLAGFLLLVGGWFSREGAPVQTLLRPESHLPGAVRLPAFRETGLLGTMCDEAHRPRNTGGWEQLPSWVPLCHLG